MDLQAKEQQQWGARPGTISWADRRRTQQPHLSASESPYKASWYKIRHLCLGASSSLKPIPQRNLHIAGHVAMVMASVTEKLPVLLQFANVQD